MCVLRLCVCRGIIHPQGLEALASGAVPLPAAAAAVDTASSMFTGWGSWLGMAPAAGTGAGAAGASDPVSVPAGSPLARKTSGLSHAGSLSSSKLGV